MSTLRILCYTGKPCADENPHICRDFGCVIQLEKYGDDMIKAEEYVAWLIKHRLVSKWEENRIRFRIETRRMKVRTAGEEERLLPPPVEEAEDGGPSA